MALMEDSSTVGPLRHRSSSFPRSESADNSADYLVLEIAREADLIALTEDVIHRDASTEDRTTERRASNADREASDDSVSDSEGHLSLAGILRLPWKQER